MSSTRWSHRPALDGIRTLAVYLVVVYHAGLAWLPGGFIGVDVFFVLSGYLVTNVLLAEIETHGRLRMRRFYARRVRRLLPAAVVTIVLVCIASVLVLPRLTREGLVDDARAALLYVANWHFLHDATDYFAESVDQSPFLHFWSLAIEEQFYVVFPLVLVGLAALGRRLQRRGVVAAGVAVLAVGSLCLQVGIAGSDPLAAYYGTHTRLYQLLAGALLAAAWQTRRTVVGGAARRVDVLVGVACVALVLAASSLIEVSAATRGLLATAIAVSIVTGVEIAPTGVVARGLSTATMTYLGRISYGTYLWHWPLIVLARPFGDPGPWTLLAIAAGGGTALAAISHRVLEMPIRRAVWLDLRPRATVAGGLAISIVCAVVLVPIPLGSDRRPVDAARRDSEIDVTGADAGDVETLLDVVPPGDLDVASTEPFRPDLSACGPSDPVACTLRSGSGLHVLLLGDSNADQLIGVLAELADREDMTLSVSTRMGCPWMQGLTWVAQDQALIDDCVATRPQWYGALIPALEPDLVIVSNVPRDPGTRTDGSVFVIDDPALADLTMPDAIARAAEQTALEITAGGARLVVIEPLPYATFDPTVCLSGAATVRDCAYPSPDGPFPTEVATRALDAAEPAVVSVDVDSIACPYQPTCIPWLGDALVFRNQFHLSDPWLIAHADTLWSAIEVSGVLEGLGSG